MLHIHCVSAGQTRKAKMAGLAREWSKWPDWPDWPDRLDRSDRPKFCGLRVWRVGFKIFNFYVSFLSNKASLICYLYTKLSQQFGNDWPDRICQSKGKTGRIGRMAGGQNRKAKMAGKIRPAAGQRLQMAGPLPGQQPY